VILASLQTLNLINEPGTGTVYGVEIHSSRVGEATVGNDDSRLDVDRKKEWRFRELSE
jgi:hypothetical protein